MNQLELDRESADLLPDRQALCSWNYGWHYDGGYGRMYAGGSPMHNGASSGSWSPGQNGASSGSWNYSSHGSYSPSGSSYSVTYSYTNSSSAAVGAAGAATPATP